MKVGENTDIEARISGLSAQFDEAAGLLEKLGKLSEDESISGVSLELLQFIMALFSEGSAESKTKSMKSSGSAAAGGASKGSSTGTTSSGPAGFLWKPVSDSDGKLAVLLPTSLTGQVAGVSVLSPSGQVVERGRNAGVGNGGREHFRFNRPGGSFPPGSIVEITLRNGSKQRIEIENTAKRVEGR